MELERKQAAPAAELSESGGTLPPPSSSVTPRRRWARVARLQDRLLQLIGTGVESRESLVSGMLERNPHESTSYWLQLVVATGIAMLGLVVGSTAVIIGAMLVAPLMGPIVALAMALATGSPFLVLRSAVRILLSVLVVIAGSASITLLLPFHELNSEIAARTTPTVLDLLTAGFCALAGVYASLRPGSETATTAAGTSIGISLVPPVCVSGYGLGTQLWPVAGGAALLFLTNLVAILFVGTVCFLAAGFNRVDVIGLERAALAKSQRVTLSAAIARRLAGLFESRAGPLLRFFMPLGLLGAVYVPLERALDQVAWEVRVRAAVKDVLDREPHEIVESRVLIKRHQVEVQVVLLGEVSDAAAARAALAARLAPISQVSPRIQVSAIPDSTALAGFEASVLRAREPLPVAPPPPAAPAEQLEVGRRLIQDVVTRAWPSRAAGEPLAVDFGAGESGPLRIEVVHLGAELGAAALESLARSLGPALGREVQLVDRAISPAALTRAEGDVNFVSRVSSGIHASSSIAALHVCVVQPAAPARHEHGREVERQLAALLHGLLAAHPRVSIEAGQEWAVRFTRDACPAAADTGQSERAMLR